MSSTLEDPAPCKSCQNLDLAHQIQAYRPGDFHTFVCFAAEAAESGCNICGVLLSAAYIFAGDTSLWNSYCKLDVVLADPPDGPLRLLCWEDGAVEAEFITTTNLADPFTQFKPAPLIAKTSNSPECFSLIQKWMAECDASHEACMAPTSVKLPTRIIDVNPTPDGLRPVLVATNGAHGRYVALSYSWGDGLPLKLTRSSLASFTSGIPWSDIPKTLQDAMTITHQLGLRYFWVDSLTIVQDDEDDWHTEAARMAAVYGNAHFTIAATHSKDCTAGIFAAREFSTRYYRVWPFPDSLTTKPDPAEELLDGEIYVRCGTRANLDSHPLQKRGWSLQEHILSRRVLQYTSDELTWHCRTAHASESRPTLKRLEPRRQRYLLSPAVLPPRQTIDASTRHLLFEYWTCVVRNYSNRKLTRESDKLVAISGVVQALSASGLGSYHSGVFGTEVLAGLAWHSEHAFPDGPWAPTHVRRCKYRAPSWSWASLDGKVDWSTRDSRIDVDHLRDPLAPCQVVRISDTELVLRGKHVQGVLTEYTAYKPLSTTGEGSRSGYSGESSRLVIGENHIENPYTDFIDSTAMHPDDPAPAELARLPLGVICLQLGFTTSKSGHIWATALVLTPSSRDDGAYERVGIDFMMDGKCFLEVEDQEFRIV